MVGPGWAITAVVISADLAATAFVSISLEISVMAARIFCTTSSQAASLSGQELTGIPSLGAASNLPMGSLLQSQGRRMIGITLACPALCRFMAMTSSVCQQYSELM